MRSTEPGSATGRACRKVPAAPAADSAAPGRTARLLTADLAEPLRGSEGMRRPGGSWSSDC